MRPILVNIFGAALAAVLIVTAAGVRADFGAGTGAPAPCFEETASVTDFVALNNIFSPAKGQVASFKITLDTPGQASLQIYTRVGILVTTLVDGQLPSGTSMVNWAGTNRAGDTVASGVYLARMVGPNLIHTEKVIVLK